MLTVKEQLVRRPGNRLPARVLTGVGAVVLLLGLALVATRGGTPSPTRLSAVADDVPATAMNQRVGPNNNSPELVADPGDGRFVVLANRLDGPDFSCALQVSGDGGASWIGANPVRKLPAGAEKCYGPEAAFDRNGRLYYLFVGLAGKGNQPMGVFLTSSVDRGRTFSVPRQVLGPLNFAARMAIDATVGRAGRIHLVWIHASSPPPLGGFVPEPNPILSAFSDDGGATLSSPVQVSDPGRARVVAPALALGPGHRVDIAYYDLGGDARDYQGLDGPIWEGTWSVVTTTSGDGGRHFSPGAVVDDKVVAPERVMLIFTMVPPALVAGKEATCIAWTDARHGDADVLARCSHDGGRRWGGVRRLNDDPTGTGARQYLPRLAVAPGGRIDAVWLDRRNDPVDVLNDTYYTFSTDGGRHFAPNRKLDRQPSNSHKGAQYAGPAANDQYEFGGRLGLLSTRQTVVAAWPDTRNSAGRAQDIFVTRILLAGGDHAAWSRAAGVPLVALGIVLLAVAGLWRRPRRRRIEAAP